MEDCQPSLVQPTRYLGTLIGSTCFPRVLWASIMHAKHFPLYITYIVYTQGP